MHDRVNPKRMKSALINARSGGMQISQVANSRAANTLSFPSSDILSAPGAVGQKLNEVMEKRITIQRLDRRSQYRELALVYHIGAFLVSNPEKWSDYCAEEELKQAAPTPRKILRAILTKYSGNGKAGQKTASRYFRALITPFERKVSAKALWIQMRKVGLDGLLQAAKSKTPNPTSVRARLAPIKVSRSCLYSIVLDQHTSQPVMLTNHDVGLWRFDLLVIRRERSSDKCKVGATKHVVAANSKAPL